MNAVPQQVSQEALPASRKVYRSGEIHKGLRVPMREITLHPSSGEAPLVVYDSSGPFTWRVRLRTSINRTDVILACDIGTGRPSVSSPTRIRTR